MSQKPNPTQEPRIMTIKAPVGESLTAQLSQGGKAAGTPYTGGIPEGMCIGAEGDVEMKIDLATGQIIGWTPPSDEVLEETFKLEKAA